MNNQHSASHIFQNVHEVSSPLETFQEIQITSHKLSQEDPACNAK
jgi:hypothetical protein